MRTGLATYPLALVLAIGLCAPAAGAEDALDEPGEIERNDLELIQAVLASPITLSQAVATTVRPPQRAIAAGFERSADGQVTLTVWTLKGSSSAPEFFAFSAPVTSAGWNPAQHELMEKSEVARAARWAAHFESMEVDFDEALTGAAKARYRDDRRASHVLSLQPAPKGMEGRVVVGELPWPVTLSVRGRVSELTRPPYLEEREEAAKRWTGRVLPELDVEKAQWLNTESPVRLADLRGQPVLLVVTDPG